MLLAPTVQHLAFQAFLSKLPGVVAGAFQGINLAAALASVLACASTQRRFDPLRIAAEFGIRSAGTRVGFTNQALLGAATLGAWLALTHPVQLPYTGRTARVPHRTLERVLGEMGNVAAVVVTGKEVLTSLLMPVALLCLPACVPDKYAALRWPAAVAGPPLAVLAGRRLVEQWRTVREHGAELQALCDELSSQAHRTAEADGRPLVSAFKPFKAVVPAFFPNAFAAPGGTVVLFSGLISRLKADKKALTFVLAHEYSHLLGRHGAELASQQLLHRGGINLAAGLAGIVAGLWRSVQLERARREDEARRSQRPLLLRSLPALPLRERHANRSTASLVDDSNVLIQMLLHVASHLAGCALSRRRESEADKLALCLARDAGMSLEDTFQGARALFSNEEQRGGKAGSFVSAALTPISTHPTPRARRTALEDAMAAAGLPPPPPGAARKRRRTRWLRWL